MDTDPGLIVRPEVARRQMDAEAVATETPATGIGPGYVQEAGEQTGEHESTPEDFVASTSRPKAKRYHGSVKLDPTRVGRAAGQIADEVVAHLSGLMGSNVRLTLEIEADISDDTPSTSCG